MSALQYSIIVGVIAGFTVLEFVLGRAQHFGATAGDNTLDMLGFALLAIFTQPTIMWMSGRIAMELVPQYHNALVDLPWYAMVGLLLLGDDMLQYWWHRLSHSPLLWPLHRAHHSAQYMSARIIYRNNFFYYVAMPSIWCAGFLVFLGLGPVFLTFIVVKMAVITGAHSSVRWDEAGTTHPIHAHHSFCPSCDEQYRRHRSLQWQLWQSAVFLGRAIWNCPHHAAIPGPHRFAGRPAVRFGKVVD